MSPSSRSVPRALRQIGLLAVLVGLTVAGGRCDAPEGQALTLRGKWVLDSRGEPIPPGSFRRGLQASGLIRRGRELWSVGDQRSQFPGHIFRIDPGSGRLIGPPLPIEAPPPREDEPAAFATYRGIPNSDFEGISRDPADPSRLFAVTEDKVPWVVTLEVEDGEKSAPPSIRIRQLSEIQFPEGLRPWRTDTNFRVEGIAVSDDSRTIYLAFERADDDLPRILSLPAEWAREGRPVQPRDMEIRFSDVPRRKGKSSARLNVNDIHYLRRKGRPCLVAAARDQERALLIDLERREVVRRLDLDFRDPEGNPIYWVSPEGVALDVKKDKLWLVNDPDSVRGNYRRRDQDRATGMFAAYAPLLYECDLSKLVGSEAPAADQESAGNDGSDL